MFINNTTTQSPQGNMCKTHNSTDPIPSSPTPLSTTTSTPRCHNDQLSAYLWKKQTPTICANWFSYYISITSTVPTNSLQNTSADIFTKKRISLLHHCHHCRHCHHYHHCRHRRSQNNMHTLATNHNMQSQHTIFHHHCRHCHQPATMWTCDKFLPKKSSQTPRNQL